MSMESAPSRPLRVLFVATAFPRHEGDVITPWMTETLRRLRTAGVDAEVLAPSYRGIGDHTIHGIPVHRFRYAPRWWETLSHDQTVPDRLNQAPIFLLLVPGYVLCGMLAAAGLTRSKRYDIIHVHWPIPHALMGWAARLAGGAKLICTWHGAELRWTRSRWPIFKGFLRWVARTADAHTVNSTHTEAELRAIGPADVAILPYGSTVSPPKENSVSAPNAVPELLFVGRLVQRKGVHILLQALTMIPDSVPFRMRIVGDGPLRPTLEKMSRSLGIADRVRFDGFVSDEALREAYQACSLFLLPAIIDDKGDTEGLGVVLIEALAFGKPAIASRIGGITDVVVDGQTGLLIDPGDAAALASAITRLIAEPELRKLLGANAQQRAVDHFSWDAIIGKTVSLYRRVLAR